VGIGCLIAAARCRVRRPRGTGGVPAGAVRYRVGDGAAGCRPRRSEGPPHEPSA